MNRWIWPFELIEKIGEGGMGTVYRARFVKDDRQVALKLLSAEYASDAVLLTRFQREMNALKQLKHPNIVKCFGGVCETKQPFYAMELIEGGSVKRLLMERRTLPWEQAVEFLLQLCSALSFAHSRGIIHRDVKPSNLLLTKSGKLKLSDFGLVYLVGATELTTAGMTLGSFRYMAPERFYEQSSASAQTDLYSVGCVLFEMIAGRVPVEGKSPAEIMHGIVEGTPPRLSALKPDCPAELDQLATDLLQKDAGDRPGSAAAVAARLRRISNTVSVKDRAPERDDSQTMKTERRSRLGGREQPASQARLPRKAVWASCLLLAVLVLWNIALHSTLSNTNQHLSQAENVLLEMYRSGNVASRLEGARALGKLGHGSPDVVEALADGLEDEKNDTIREATVIALGQLGAPAKRAAAKLYALQKDDPNDDVREAATVALKRIRAAESGWSLGSILLVVGAIVAIVGAIVSGLRKLAPQDDERRKGATDPGSGRPIDTLASEWLDVGSGRRK